ncbi:hypothetical protein B0T26DRAFT_645465 [Lasiosphaeria miniovina]|uniref:sn-1-specific diacylglycerol lipase n=1 Tax=Lasiosphaeria miniovina TaxID=1954250 RepID=A0AA40DZJ7_9PEZI|nr:uncharacterized protein B0T26DRAFT_645465 [Lasiosphaeria miniovina]KAK0717228.1 hypothetical protein B0T26DRAFT_645465 [Lasiosphaeria miniovina]
MRVLSFGTDDGADADGNVDMDPSSSARLAVAADDHVTAQLRELAASSPGRTLLPVPLARAVSFATRSTSLALRMGTLISGYGFDAAKVTTLSSLELGRAILESILGRAGRDVIGRSGSLLARAEAETVLEKSLENLHRTMTQIVFWTTTGFHVTGTTLAVITETSQLLLSALDQFFGSTDSSRAMASIITLIRREFQNPATGVKGEKVGVLDLMLGLCGMAYLQRWCRRSLEDENRTLHVEETVWDVVVFSDGVRVDLHEESLYGVHNGAYGSGRPPTGSGPNGRILETIESHGAQDSDGDGDGESLPEIRLKRQIMKSLPDNAKVSITTQINTIKTITVDITGRVDDLPVSPPPPGVELIEERRDSRQVASQAQLQQGNKGAHSAENSIPPTYRVVYRLHRNKERRTSFQKEDGDISQVAGYVEAVDDDDDDESESDDGSATEVDESPSLVRPKIPRPLLLDSPSNSPFRRPSSSASATSGSSSPSTARPSRIPPVEEVKTDQGAEQAANQKRPRMPPTSPSALAHPPPSAAPRRNTLNRFLSSKNKDDGAPAAKSSSEGKGGFRNAFRRSATMFSKDDSGSETAFDKKKGGKIAPKTAKNRPAHSTPAPLSHLAVVAPARQSSLIPRRGAPQAVSRAGRGQGWRSGPAAKEMEEPYVRSDSRASYISVHESRRDSSISQTETYSITTADDYHPVSPSSGEKAAAASAGSAAKALSERDVSGAFGMGGRNPRRVKSQMYSPSIYTLSMNESQSSLVPYGYYQQKSAFSDTEALGTLRRAGRLDGMFPRYHLLRNITRYMRFASASYGSNFLKVLGIAKEMPILRTLDDLHHELRSFAHHTESDASSILLSSFVDPQGGSDGTGSTNTGVPLVHYISLDHESKAVVLACRGTLGFEDVLADMTCDYDDLIWRGKVYKVHKGIHASAQRLLYGGDGRVLHTLKKALDDFPDYGLVLTGHSLGGAVTALLGVMLSEPEPSAHGTAFVTSSEPHTRLLADAATHHPSSLHHNLHYTTSSSPPRHVCLPSGRPVHVFAYGPPSTMSASLCTATRGLITSIVHGNDLVPYLSLGVLHDFQAVALAFKTDNNEAKVEVRQRIWEALQSGLADKWYGGPPASSRRRKREDDDQWAYAALKVLRASMMSQKLLPPGEVFVVESTRVRRRDAFLLEGEDADEPGHFGRPAQRVVLKYVRDVEKRFREVRFGTSMLTDHSPGKYEDALNKLKAGVMDS